MSWEIAVAGTVTLDDVTTPHGHRADQQGGSAVYFALAASRYAPVHLAGVVGRDGEPSVRATLAGTDTRTAGLQVVDAATFRWKARHDFERWVTGEESSDEGAYREWRPLLSPAAQAAPVLFVGSMRPDLQVEVMRQSSARLIASDSMTVFIGVRGDEVRAVAEDSDILFLNRSELAALTGDDTEHWRESARSLCGRGRLRAVVVKAGPVGAAVVTARNVIECAAQPVEAVLDPTGAGDSLAGGFLGACARAERADEDFFPEALREGMRCAADAIVAFGTEALRRRDTTAHLVSD